MCKAACLQDALDALLSSFHSPNRARKWEARSELVTPGLVSSSQQMLLAIHWDPVSHLIEASGMSPSYQSYAPRLQGVRKSDPTAVTAPFLRPQELPIPIAVQQGSHFSAIEAESDFADTAPCHHQNCT